MRRSIFAGSTAFAVLVIGACTAAAPGGLGGVPPAPGASPTGGQAARPAQRPTHPGGSGPLIEGEAESAAYAEAYGAILATTVGRPACLGPRGAYRLAVRARQPNGKEFDYNNVGWSQIGSDATSGGQVLLGSDGKLWIEHGEPRDGYVSVGTYAADRIETGVPVRVSLAPGSILVAGFPMALYDESGWVTIRFTGPEPALMASPPLHMGTAADCGRGGTAPGLGG